MTNDSLQTELCQFMNALGIVDWMCEKPRKKGIAWVSFLHASDGNKFLQRHKSVKRQAPQNAVPTQPSNSRKNHQDIAQLVILATPVFVQRSDRPIDKHKMSHLQHNREKQAQPSKHDLEEPTPLFRIIGIACGRNIFDTNGTLTFVEETSIPKMNNASVRFNSRLISVSISQILEDGARLEFHNHTIQDLVAETGGYSLTLVLTEPPRMFILGSSIDSQVKWRRVRSISWWNSHEPHVATNLVYRITLANARSLAEIATFLKRRPFLEITRHHLPIMQSYQIPDYRQQFDARNRQMMSSGLVPFALLFQVEALVRNNYLRPSSGIHLLDILKEFALDSMQDNVAFPVTTDTLKQLSLSIPYPCPGTDPDELDALQIMEKVRQAEHYARVEDPHRDPIYGTKVSRHQAWVFKATVTPTRVLLNGPDAESRNRVLRMFPNHNDYFLRVTFCDEDGQDLDFSPRVSNEEIFRRYRSVLRDGIEVAGRSFSFLGFSHSSLRAHSVWFVAPFNQHTYTTILSSLGDFSDIRVPAKCAARIGQAFSETPYAITLANCGIGIVDIPDVKSADGSRVFSDGVGTISMEALQEIWPALSARSAPPTCLQIRLGGYKGMVSLDSRLGGKMLCLRKESMMKFPSSDLTELGICDTSSRPLRLVLNRQLIKIMEDMGTEEQWFFKMQQQALNIFRTVTANAQNTSKFLRHQAIGVNAGFSKLVPDLDRMRIDYRRDEFMKSAVEHVVLQELRLLKHKARIPVEHGVTLFGIMDETGFLNDGEVYVTYDKRWSGSGARIPETLKDGEIIVTRSPALHPGDVRVVQMVTPPRGHPLRDLENCIVFSQKGTRDLPSMLSGGDLDGDIYNIIWDRDASPKRMFSPADYPRVTPISLDRPVTRDDIADFFINFMKTDLLGMIATRHVILADAKTEGTVDPECVRLANLHSTAVDFSKTGIPVEFSELPRAPHYRPDFLARAPPLELHDLGQISYNKDPEDGGEGDVMVAPKHKFYKSEKILGKLFRDIDEEKIWDEDIHRKVSTAGPSVWDQLLGLVGVKLSQRVFDIDWERKSQEAWKIRNNYDSAVENLMFDYSDNPRSSLTEVEVFCGFILNKRGGQTRRQRDSSIKLKEEIDRVMTWIVKLMRNRETGSDAETMASRVPEGSEAVVELCWACLAIGCISEASASPPSYHGSCELRSFRVVAACCLVKEFNLLMNDVEVGSGGYVGVRGGGSGRTMTVVRR
ncbi:RNA dependent RNA polymerase-domain-containing protein [Ilyonectria sp. MPI-CAGE-AT-0026]|nr:RNA dependent RNA polymerase-domain-containing protein [Ilyonectria sp. MPI-CAGE-AT-0026]